MLHKDIKVVSIDTKNKLYTCNDGNEYPLMEGLETLPIEELQKYIDSAKQTTLDIIEKKLKLKMDKLLTLKETENILNVSKSTLQRWDNSGKLKAIRTEGGHRRYKQSDIDEILKDKDGITYSNLYQHLCSAQYIADSLKDDDANAILKIRERVGQKLLNEYNKMS